MNSRSLSIKGQQPLVLPRQGGGGEILVSSLLKELTESASDIAFGDGREVELRGLSGQHHVFEVGWEKPTSRSAH